MANEKRLIWDEDAKRHLIALAVGHHTETLHIDMILNAILHHTPTVDAVEVVRCKECKHCQDGHCNHFGYFSYAPQVSEDDFCSYGERKGNERKAD